MSESFEEVWVQLSRIAGATPEVAECVGDFGSLRGMCGLIISAGGAEKEALDTLKELRSADAPETVVVGAETDYRLVASLINGGAANYFAMPHDLTLCRSWLEEQVQRVLDLRKAEEFAAEERNRFDFSKLIGNSPRLLAALKRTSRVIPRGAATVLITGETGTGKELVANAVHYNSDRATGPFVAMNCTAMPANLLEAEVFGYEAGAFTDARVAKPGLVEIADGGTIFLDEIGDLPPTVQAKLLRVLEDRRVRRLGSIRDVEVDIRVIAATHVDLPAAIAEGNFREDLFYRLNVVPVHLPPLRERGDDVLLIAEHFLDFFSEFYEVSRPKMPDDVKRALTSYSWPGNVRELRNAMERGVLLGNGLLFLHDVFPDDMPRPSSGPLPFPASLQAIEVAAAHAMVARCGGNKSEAAKLLGTSRKHLYTLLSRKVEGK